MKSLWSDQEVKPYSHSDLQLRVYTSRLLGWNDQLVLHGGGNTSVKITEPDLFGEPQETLYVKGSGWDLKTIEAAGFAPTKLQYLKKLGTLPTLTDSQMAKELKASQLNPIAPAPSVEAILHANIPFKYVDHTHTDAVVAISNTPDGEQKLKELYGDRVLILPYIMPGFILAKQVYEATLNTDWQQLDGILLLHHGLFTFHDDARQSYENMINLVSKAEQLLQETNAYSHEQHGDYQADNNDYLQLAEMRKTVSALAGQAMLAQWQFNRTSVGFSQRSDAFSIATRGPLTPDHTLHTKPIPAIIENDPVNEINKFADQYTQYFERYTNGTLTQLDPAPRFAIWKNKGSIAFAPNHKRLAVISDITEHTLKAIQWGEALGGWQALPEKDIFDIEYWELEQAKLKKSSTKPLCEGKVVLVTGAASGIGKACVETFIKHGACVIGLDINPIITEQFSAANYLGLVCDVTDTTAVKQAIQNGVGQFGGLDTIISNAGSFPASKDISELEDEALQQSLELNFNSHVRLIRECTPYLKMGIDPSIIIIASKNVPAPGPGAGAYSAAKAALTQIARVAALELGKFGIRVNTLHPNAVFDTGVWTDEVLQQRAKKYQLTVDAYKTNNVLQTEVTSENVAELALAMAGKAFSKTTGAQLAVDGGNDRVI